MTFKIKMDYNIVQDKLFSFSVDSNRIKLLKNISKHFVCQICKGVLDQTVLLKECGHRYCRTCITTSLNQYRLKKCPECFANTGRLGWTPDYQYDHLKMQFYQLLKMDLANPDTEFTLIPYNKHQTHIKSFKLKTKQNATGISIFFIY